MAALTLIDGHVHFYDCYDEADFLEAAARNFSAQASLSGSGEEVSGVLMLTETSRHQWFRTLKKRLSQGGGKAAVGIWQLSALPEDPDALAIRSPGRPAMVLIAGRQIITAEALEVLALGADRTYQDGQSLPETIDTVIERGAVPVIPWAVGKWLGRRGRVVREYLHERVPADFLLGDNGGRPALSPHPSQFSLAARRGIKILPGSDPLPMAYDVARVGQFGACVRLALSATHPARHIRQLLQDPQSRLEPFGRLQGLWPFLRRQADLRMKRAG